MSEVIAGYRAGNVNWDDKLLGPPLGAAGCRVDPAILREYGF